MKQILSLVDNYTFIDKNKEPEVLLPLDITTDTNIGAGILRDFVCAVPYYIRKIYYAGEDEFIVARLSEQFKCDGLVFVRPTYEIAVVVTTYCNLACNNCNMLSNNKDTNSTISMSALSKFMATYPKDRNDTMIRLTGGEPTILGDKLHDIIEMFWLNGFKYITLLTNGINDFVPKYPISIENSSKIVGIAPDFNTQYIAPIDLVEFSDMPVEIYAGGCIQADVCGYAYTQEGNYFPCPTGAMIYPLLRAKGLVPDYESKSLDDTINTRHTFFTNVCKYCGMFKKGGYHSLDRDKFERTTGEPRSKSWQ